MDGRKRWIWLIVLAVVVLLIGLWQDQRGTRRPAPAHSALGSSVPETKAAAKSVTSGPRKSGEPEPGKTSGP